MKKMLLVLNPYAGTRKANKYLPEIIAIFNRAGYDVLTYMTAGAGDCAREVQEKAPQMDLVVCAGGDGTFNETISGILRSGADVPVGYIPAGSTNDFAASLGLSANVVQAAQDIVEGEPVRYDVGRFADRYFSYVASFGAFTKASYSTPQSVKNALGHMAYILEGIQELSQIRKIPVRIVVEDQVIEDDFIFGAISNSTSMGGILSLDPKQVDMQDGQFELLLVRSPQDILEISECIRALQSQKYNCKMITFLSAPRVRVETQTELDWTLDGEHATGGTVVEAENLHLAISLVRRKETV